MRKYVFMLVAIVALASCKKSVQGLIGSITPGGVVKNQYITYTIPQGQQYSDKSSFEKIAVDQLSFFVRFDSSAVYKTQSASNQSDINKLYGFSDNDKQHHEYSARFGWNWLRNAVHLYAYVYNNGAVISKEIGTVNIGAENSCSIKVSGTSYIFILNDKTVTMPRSATTVKGTGYRLFPYFGGDEVAPQKITIAIKEV